MVRQTFFLEAGGGGGANKGCLPFTKRFRKSGWKVNWARLSGSFQRNISGSNRIFEEKVVLFFWTGLMFHFFKAIFYTSFRLSLPFFGKCSWFVQMVNEILWRRWPVLNFGYHIPKPWMDRFAHANNKQQLTSEKRDSLGPKLGARAFMGLSGGRACKQTWRKATWNVSAGLKQLKIAKRKVELTGKKTLKCEAEGRRCAWDKFTSRKTRRMHRETASEMVSLPWSQNHRKENAAGYVSPLVFYKMPDQGSSWSYLCRKAHNNCMSRHIFEMAARLVSPNNPINVRALSLGPRLSLFYP